MKVLVLTKSFGTLGGAERWLDLLARGLATRNFDFRVALADGEHHNALKYAEAHPALKAMFLRNPSGAPSSRLRSVRRALLEVRPDIVIPLMLFDGLLGAVLEKKRSSYRIVYPLHGSRAGALQDVRNFDPYLDAIVPVDAHTKRLLELKSLAPSEFIRLIPAGVPAPKRSAELFQQSRVRLGYCGRLEQYDKRVLDLVELATQLSSRRVPFQLSIAGGGSKEEELKTSLQQRLGGGAPVSFLGTLEPEVLYESFFPNIDVLVVTSESEAGPLVAIEAMLHGCVVLTSDFQGRRAGGLLVEDLTALVFPIGDLSRAAVLIESLVADHALAARLSQAGRVAASPRTADAMTSAWNELLSTIASHPRRLPRDFKLPAPNYRHASRLERFGVPAEAADRLRRLLGRRFRHATPSSEWPFHSIPDPDLEDLYLPSHQGTLP